MPLGVDPELNTVTVMISGTKAWYSTVVGRTISLFPNFIEPPISYIVTTSYFDGALTTNWMMTVNLINDPPRFTDTLVDVIAYEGSTERY